MKRRDIVLLPSAIVTGALVSSCGKHEIKETVVTVDETLKEAAAQLPPEIQPFIKEAGLVAIRYRIKTVKMEHWALRLLGVTLILSGSLVVRYVRGNNGKEAILTLKLEEPEVQKLEQERKLIAIRGDGKEEVFPITEVKMQDY